MERHARVSPAEPASEWDAASPAHAQDEALSASELFLSRELTWLNFNRRVLNEALDARNPLLERLKFLAISDSNLDEFVMKRIGGLKQQIAAGVHTPTVDGRTPSDQLKACYAEIHALRISQDQICDMLLKDLADNGIQITEYSQLTPDQRAQLREHFVRNIFPTVTPLAMDPAHPFPFISNLAMNLLVTLRYPNDDETYMARVKVPIIKGVSSRFVQVGDELIFVRIEDLMENNLDTLFPGMDIVSCETFRITRNAIVELEQETANDLLEMIESELRERHFAPIVRLEVRHGMSLSHRGMLGAELGLDQRQDVFDSKGLLAMRDLMEIAALNLPQFQFPPHYPSDHPLLGKDSRSMFHIVREHGSLLVQHPYQSFATSVVRLLQTASEDPKVLAIKMTLYRTSADSEIIPLLAQAARNGKQVAVLVELKARFDEEANIGWARHLEESGIHVTYGVLGLKTHSKIMLIVRRDYDGLRRYAHIGTGNYHSGTARLYCDLGLITCDPDIGHDLTQMFNYLTAYSPPPSYRKILVSPNVLKRNILKCIDREIAHAEAGREAHLQLKTNALEDTDVVRSLYKATRAGVKVDLIIRDTCRFRPGIPGLSESGRVVSIIGRFLEHSRIYYFKNGGEEEYFIGSADLMRRNLEARVEVVVPVEEPALREELRLMLNTQLGDYRSAWEMQSDGSYTQRMPDPDGEKSGTHELLIKAAQKRAAAAAVHRERKVRDRLLNRSKRRLRAADS